MKNTKVLLLALQNLKAFMKHKTPLFLIITFGLSASICAVLFYSGYFLKQFENMNKSNEYTFKIINNNSNTRVSDIINEMKNASIIPYRIKAFSNDPDAHNLSNLDNKNIEVIGDEFLSDMPENLLLFGDYFKKDNLDNQTLITSAALRTLGIEETANKEISLNGHIYSLIGLVSPFYYLPYDDKCIVVPLSKFIEEYKVKYVHFEYKNQLTNQQTSYLSKLLEKYPGIEMKLPKSNNFILSPVFAVQLFQIALIFTLSFINIFSLYFFWIKNNKRNYSIYKLCGSNRRITTIIIIINNLIISLIGIILGTVLFCFISPFLIRFEIINTFSIDKYWNILLIIVTFAVILAIVLGIRYNKDEKLYKISGE